MMMLTKDLVLDSLLREKTLILCRTEVYFKKHEFF